MEYTWSDFWTTRRRSSFLFPRRATRPQRGPYEVLGASRSTKPARSHGRSNVTCMSLEARPWLVDLHATAALDSFPFSWVVVVSGVFCVLRCGFFSLVFFWCFLRLEFWVFLLGCFWCFLNFQVRVWSVSRLIGLGSLVPAFSVVLPTPPLSAGLGVVPSVCLFASFLFSFSVLPSPPTQCWAMVWVIGPLN